MKTMNKANEELEKEKKEYRDLIYVLIYTIEKNYKYKKNQKLDFETVLKMVTDLNDLFEAYQELDYIDCAKIIIKKHIKILNLLIVIDEEEERQVKYHDLLENAYRMAGRASLQHFIMYYEWEEDNKLYENRVEILKPYVYFLNKMCFDPTFEGMIVNLPSGYGKSRLVRLYEAFRMGVCNGEGTFLALCSNDSLIKGQSRSVIDIIKSERFGKVFPKMKYDKNDKDYFLKETDGEWKLRNCKLIASYYASTVKSNVVGERASLSIDIDDLYSGYMDALNETTNEQYENDYKTVWRKRYVQDKTPQIIVTGTLWSPTDFLARLIELWEKESEFILHPKFKFTKISKDGTKVIIQVPALDYETGESTCPRLRSTKELLKEKATMSNYLWETNFQQRPIPPEGLDFDYSNLKTYENLILDQTPIYKAVIDGTRKSGKDFFAMPIFGSFGDKYVLVDAIFTKTATSELTEDIVDKIMTWHIVELVIESNVDGGLKKYLDEKLESYGVYYCRIREKYNTIVKATRIELEKGNITRRLIFPAKGKYSESTEIGKYMNNLTTYSSLYPNKNDDAPDSAGMFTSEILGGKTNVKKIKAVIRPF